jgi:apoptosis-inducing factor 2
VPWQIASTSTLLNDCPSSVSKIASSALRNVNVDVRLSTKVVNSVGLTDGQHDLKLSDGSKLHADLYITTFGLLPNSSYLTADCLNDQGFVMVDEYLRLKGRKDVWAIGDVSDVENCQFITCDRQSAYLSKSLVMTLKDQIPQPYGVGSSRELPIEIVPLGCLLIAT